MNQVVRPFLPFVVAILAAGACQSMVLAEDAPLLPVSVTHPLTEHITTWDEYSGRFVAVKSVEVRPRVSGFIDKVNFVDGATVKQGDLLFTIDQRPFAIAVESAKGRGCSRRGSGQGDGRRCRARQATCRNERYLWARLRSARGQSCRCAGAAAGRPGGRKVGPAQLRVDRSQGADRRPYLGQEGQ